MAKPSSNPNPFGDLTPQNGDIVLTSDDTPEKVMSQIMIASDDDTGVFFFRNQRRMYMRIVEFG
jgi:hypothetical protein